MYICVCAAVTDREIRAKVAEGAHTLDDLRIDLGVALQCGTCACAAENLICETRAKMEAKMVERGAGSVVPLPTRQPAVRRTEEVEIAFEKARQLEAA
ncbi:MAG: (2Fe-2S)-binding protein [Burkholderiaceae bacterium]|jgi:bacterioferritin-associated ferredoxin